MPVFLKYGDIKGGVTEPAHRSWIELVSAGLQGPSGVSGGAGSGTGEPKFKNLIDLEKKTDRSSASLMRVATSGAYTALAVIDFVRKGGGTYLRFEMSNPAIGSYSKRGRGNDALESLQISFTGMKVTQQPGTPPP